MARGRLQEALVLKGVTRAWVCAVFHVGRARWQFLWRGSSALHVPQQSCQARAGHQPAPGRPCSPCTPTLPAPLLLAVAAGPIGGPAGRAAPALYLGPGIFPDQAARGESRQHATVAGACGRSGHFGGLDTLASSYCLRPAALPAAPGLQQHRAVATSLRPRAQTNAR